MQVVLGNRGSDFVSQAIKSFVLSELSRVWVGAGSWYHNWREKY